MSWTIHVRRDEHLVRQPAKDLQAALAAACLLLREGIVVESIEGPDALRITGDAVRSLCEGREDLS